MGRAKGCAAIGASAWFVLASLACGSGGDSVLSGAGASNSERQNIGSEGDSQIVAGNTERQTIRVARRGGQSGMEGSCLPVPDREPFSADDVRALIAGTRATTLAYRAEQRAPGSSFDDTVGLSMTVKVELEGEPRIDTEPFEACVFRIIQDVKVTLSFDEPALDVVIETYADAISATFALVQLELGSNVAEALGLPPGEVTFSLAFDASGIEGSFDPYDACGRAVFPASVRCPDWSSIEVDLERHRPGLRSRMLSALEGLRDVPLAWGDGTRTTVTLSLAEAPEWACSGAWIETFCPERLTVPASIRAVTADGRLDAQLPAELALDVATEVSAMDASAPEPFCSFARTAGEIESLHVSASYFGVTAGGTGPEIIPPLEANAGFSLQVWRAPESPERAAAELRMHALEERHPGLTPPLDATLAPASASCVVFGPYGVEESP